MRSKTSFHAEGLCSPTQHFDRLHFSEDLAGGKTTTARMLQGQGKGNIKVIEVKGQYHFAILLVKKLQFLQLMTYLS